ncbi:MAG: sensor histidine kinase [Deltaproteobacteria bacterium]|jgi:signal transduction histidine kinase|nr:sensor histidine kinase [Deltaproteobacteria bacterium]
MPSSIWSRLKPRFWDHEDAIGGPYKHHFDFRRIWKRAVSITAIVALVPLIIWALAGYRLNLDTIESELVLRTSQLVSNSWRSVSLFISERRSVLDFITHDHTFETLHDKARLAAILDNLNRRIGGFTDLGVINSSGIQQTYAGPHQLEGLDYSSKPWFQQVLKHGVYISELVTGFRSEPHLDAAVKRNLPDGSFFVLRAALDARKLNELVAQFEVGEKSDAFIITRKGVLQTPSRYYGPVFNQIPIRIPDYSPKAQVFKGMNDKKERLVIGYAYIPETPFILMIVKQKGELIQPWYKTGWAFTGILATSILGILLVTLAVTSRLVDQIHEADQERVDTLHQAEYTQKMVSLGRLASGVAHEINNPLAIINQKAGHIKDIFTLTRAYKNDPKLIGLVDSVLATVHRCAEVTKGLLNFARHLNLSVQTVSLAEIIDEVNDVLAKEAETRSITIGVNYADNVPHFESDRGKLEQIFFNLFNNAITVMKDGGHLEISVKRENTNSVAITFANNGPGIPEAEIKHVFEPFFYTKAGESGTGLGLAVTYALVQEIGGQIRVQSELGKGTQFHIRLPLEMERNKSKNASGYDQDA